MAGRSQQNVAVGNEANLEKNVHLSKAFSAALDNSTRSHSSLSLQTLGLSRPMTSTPQLLLAAKICLKA